MRVGIVNFGRTHMLNIARELYILGVDVVYYSALPKSRTRSYGVPDEHVFSFFFLLSPLLFLIRVCRRPRCLAFITYLADSLLGRLTGLVLGKFDVVIASPTVAHRVFRKARRYSKTVCVCDCGIRHVLDEEQINKINNIASLRHERCVRNHLRAYECADYIMLASTTSFMSFTKRGYASNRLFINPYGTDISLFFEKEIRRKSYDFIFVGQWIYRKGCDILAELMERNPNWSMLHVGNIGDLAFPSYANMYHVDAVCEEKLPQYYSSAKILVLPSRSDGFGMVLTQAISSGLPVVYSQETGGPDLKNLLNGNDALFEIRELCVDALENTLKKALQFYDERFKEGLSIINECEKRNLSWEAYGKRYLKFLNYFVLNK